MSQWRRACAYVARTIHASSSLERLERTVGDRKAAARSLASDSVPGHPPSAGRPSRINRSRLFFAHESPASCDAVVSSALRASVRVGSALLRLCDLVTSLLGVGNEPTGSACRLVTSGSGGPCRRLYRPRHRHRHRRPNHPRRRRRVRRPRRLRHHAGSALRLR